MNQQTIIDIGAESAMVSIKIAAPALLAIMITGFVVSLFQAATQINEQTMSFIPKILAMSLVMFLAAPWILQTLLFFTTTLFKSLPDLTR